MLRFESLKNSGKSRKLHFFDKNDKKMTFFKKKWSHLEKIIYIIDVAFKRRFKWNGWRGGESTSPRACL